MAGWTPQGWKDFTFPEINKRVDVSGGFPVTFEIAAGPEFYQGGAYLSVGTDHNDGPVPGDPRVDKIIKWTIVTCETAVVPPFDLYDPEEDGGADGGDAGQGDAEADASADASTD